MYSAALFPRLCGQETAKHVMRVPAGYEARWPGEVLGRLTADRKNITFSAISFVSMLPRAEHIALTDCATRSHCCWTDVFIPIRRSYAAHQTKFKP